MDKCDNVSTGFGEILLRAWNVCLVQCPGMDYMAQNTVNGDSKTGKVHIVRPLKEDQSTLYGIIAKQYSMFGECLCSAALRIGFSFL